MKTFDFETSLLNLNNSKYELINGGLFGITVQV
jgi:hypothetical protein